MRNAERVTLKTSLVGGVLLTIGSVSFVTLIVLLVSWAHGTLRVALAGFGTALFLAAAAMLFTPILGGLVSLGNRSWYAFKIWTAAGAVALLLNLLIGYAALEVSNRL